MATALIRKGYLLYHQNWGTLLTKLTNQSSFQPLLVLPVFSFTYRTIQIISQLFTAFTGPADLSGRVSNHQSMIRNITDDDRIGADKSYTTWGRTKPTCRIFWNLLLTTGIDRVYFALFSPEMIDIVKNWKFLGDWISITKKRSKVENGICRNEQLQNGLEDGPHVFQSNLLISAISYVYLWHQFWLKRYLLTVFWDDRKARQNLYPLSVRCGLHFKPLAKLHHRKHLHIAPWRMSHHIRNSVGLRPNPHRNIHLPKTSKCLPLHKSYFFIG